MAMREQWRGAPGRRAFGACLAAELLLLATTALAQTVTAAPPQIEQMVVTARRRQERQQRVPTAITAIGGKDLQRRGVVNTNDLARAVPSLTIGGQQRSDSEYYLRGQTPGIINQGVHNNSSVTIYFLEVPTITSGPGTFYDMQSVEVLKGPQGTLFGRNTTGGAILFTPVKPRDDYSGYVQGRFGNYNDTEGEGAANFPLIPDKLDLRVAGAIARRDGFTTNVVTGEKLDDRNYDAYRVSLDAHPSDNFDNLLVLDGRLINQNGTSAIPMEFNPNVVLRDVSLLIKSVPLTLSGPGPSIFCLQGYGPLSSGGFNITTPIPGCPPGLFPTVGAALAANNLSFYPPGLLNQILATQRALGPRQFASDAQFFDQERAFDATNISTWTSDSGLELKNIFGYRFERRNTASDFAGSILPMVRNTNTESDWGEDALQQLTDELQLQGTGLAGRLHYILGTYFENADPGQPTVSRAVEFGPGPEFANVPALYGPATIASSVLNYHKFNDKSESVYLHGDYDLGQLLYGLKIDAGIRYSWDEREASINQLNYYGQCVSRTAIYTVGGQPVCFTRESAQFTAPTWSVTLSDQINPQNMAYVTLRRGYKTGGFNLPAPRDLNGNVFDQSFQPEYIFDTEVGLKSDWHIDQIQGRTNLALFHDVYSSIQASFAEVVGGTIASVVQNAGRAHIDGLELEQTLVPNRLLQVSGYFSLLRAVFATPFEQEGVQLKGTQLFYSPIQKYGLTGTLNIPVPERYGGLAVTGDFSLSTHYTIADPLDPMPYFKGQENLNVRADWSNIYTKPIDLAFIMTNALNKTYAVGGYPIYGLAGFRSNIYDEPRMAVAQLTLRWGPGAAW